MQNGVLYCSLIAFFKISGKTLVISFPPRLVVCAILFSTTITISLSTFRKKPGAILWNVFSPVFTVSCPVCAKSYLFKTSTLCLFSYISFVKSIFRRTSVTSNQNKSGYCYLNSSFLHTLNEFVILFCFKIISTNFRTCPKSTYEIK